jgi:hypothetical protein
LFLFCKQVDVSYFALILKGKYSGSCILDLIRVLLQTGPTLNQMLNQFGPAMELSTLGCSSMHNNTLHFLHRTTLVLFYLWECENDASYLILGEIELLHSICVRCGCRVLTTCMGIPFVVFIRIKYFGAVPKFSNF